MIKMSTLSRINTAVAEARANHPSVNSDLFKELVEEVGEVAKAMVEGSSQMDIELEVLDCIAVLVRMIEKE